MSEYREISVARDERPARKAAVRPAPRAPAGRRTRPALDGRRVLGALLRTCRSRPAGILGSLAILGAVAAICVNALGSQSGRHPAPILPKVAIRQDAARPSKAPDPAAAEPARAAEAAKPPRDPIAALIRQEETTASVTPKPAAKAEKTEKTDAAVLQAQRALNKLGYGPLKTDGLMGPGTRAALEKFERDRKLPVKGEAGGRTLRELAARSSDRQG